MGFIEMDPELVRNLIEGEEDLITQAVDIENEFYKHVRCTMCGQGECERKMRPPKVVMGKDGPVVTSPFGDGILPESFAHCIHCGTDFNPFTGMIFKTEASMIHAPESDPHQH